MIAGVAMREKFIACGNTKSLQCHTSNHLSQIEHWPTQL
jgi:hypothetical protein